MYAKALAAAGLALAASAATAADVGVAGAFSKGRMHFAVTAGSGLIAIWPARIKRTRQGGQLRDARQSIAIAPARRRAA